jgi:hypothetical protein
MKQFILTFWEYYKKALILFSVFVGATIVIVGAFYLFGWLMGNLPISTLWLKITTSSVITLLSLSAIIGLIGALFDE